MTTTKLSTWKIQTRVNANRWSIITVEAAHHEAAIALAERLTGGRFVKIED